MKNRAIEHSPIVKSRKVSPPVRASNPTTSKGENYHKKCTPAPASAQSKPSKVSTLSKPTVNKLPDPVTQKPLPVRPASTVTEKSRPASVKPSTSKPLGKQVSEVKQKPTPVPPSRLELTREDSKQLTSKFGQVSTTLLQVATAKRPVGARSLEALINLEISNSVGDALNDPAFAQGFIQATRRLLEELIRLDEAGKLNPKLLREGGRKKKPFIRASSATTVCYRDQYFKELVMNVLQSMNSSKLEEEVAGKAVHSEESRERIQVIRDMVRTEAGLEPENFKELERRLEELRRSLSKNKLEMEKAVSEVDKIIAQHIVSRELSVSSLQIPGPARDVFRSSYKRLESGSDEGTCKTGTGCCKQTRDPRNTVGDGGEKYKKSLDILGEKECFEKGNSDEVKNIRPQLKNLVHEELLRIKKKEEEIINRDGEFDRSDRLADSPKSSFESLEFKSAASNMTDDDDDDDDDAKENNETSEEETRTFVDNLKAEIAERKITDEDLQICGPQGVTIRVLERIDEDEEEMNHTETEGSGSSISGHSKLSSVTSGIGLKPLEFSNENSTYVRKTSNENVEKQPSANCLAERVRSTWFYPEASEIQNVLSEMRDAFESFKVVSDVFSSFKIREESENKTRVANEATLFNKNFNLLEFTVGEVANILVDISVKMSNLPKYLKETSSSNVHEEREQAIHILSVLEKHMNASKPVSEDVIVSSDQTALPIENIANTFYFLSNTLKSSPREVKFESISILNPPKSLVETLNTLSSTEYFRDCFMSLKRNINEHTETSKSVEVVKPYDMNENRSSGDIYNFDLDDSEDKPHGYRKKIYSYTRDIKGPNDFKENIDKFEHFMGRTASVMTIQNVSDMFLFLSAILNDVPDRIKSEKIIDMDPPPSLLKALDILYCEDDPNSVTELEKTKSFASLTIQNVSDFLLTLSKTFDDVPNRLKDSTVAELRPPQSLLRAISLLTSLSHLSIPESYSQEIEPKDCSNLSLEHHEKFFDAEASMNTVN